MKTYNAAQVFKTIIDQGSMIKAAEFLSISPSVVSKKLAFLEGELGAQLLKRTTRKLELTEAGSVFYERICDISNCWISALEEVAHLNSQPTGTLRICAPQPLSSRLLVPALQGFQRLYPKIKLEVVHKVYEELPDMQADLTICRKLLSFNSSNVVGLPLFNYQNGLFAAPSYLQRYSEIQMLNELSDHQCINYGVAKQKHSWVFTNGSRIVIEPTVVSDNTEIIISSAVNGFGICYIPAVIIENELKENSLVAVLPELQSSVFETYLYYQKLNVVPKKLRLMIDFLKLNL
jgi:DNA-binding transcriptional LysR family regulator